MKFRRPYRQCKARNRKSRRSSFWLSENPFIYGRPLLQRRLLAIEPLESRRVLSGVTLTVNTFFDTDAANPSTSDLDASGNVSLRSAIEYLNATATAGDTIAFALPSGTTAISLTLGPIVIQESMAISGPGASALTIDQTTSGGAPVFRVLTTDANNNAVNVSMSGLTLTGGNNVDGHYAYGGGIDNDGDLSLNAMTLAGNNSASVGGGIYNGGTLTITDSTLSGNSAGQPGSIAGAGGGIFNDIDGTLTVTDSTLSGNSSNGPGLLDDLETVSSGGGIYNNVGTLTVTDSTISGNSAAVGGGIYSYSYGATVVNVANTDHTNRKATDLLN